MGREEIFVRLLATLGHTFNHGARRVRELYDWLPGSGRALRRSEKELSDVIEAMPATVWRTSPDGSVDFINQNWVQATGLPSEAALGWNWQTVVHPDDRRRCIAEWNKAMKDRQPMKSEVRVRCADGEYCLWFIQNVPLRDEQGNVVKWYGSAINIQDRKRAEQERDHLHQLQDELAHINRVTTLGELASIAHELKQPITAAIINAKTCFRWLESAPPDLHEAREAIHRVVKDSVTAANIIDRLRALHKKQTAERELVDINEVIGEMLVPLRSEASQYPISVRAQLAAALPQTVADRVQLQQVLMNLGLNAIDAMKDEGGELTISSEQTNDGLIRISLIDAGMGLPTEQIDQIFSAFFTTKPQGTGMGLAITRSLIEAHGGRLWASSNSGCGATFHFTLPVRAKVVEMPQAPDSIRGGELRRRNSPAGRGKSYPHSLTKPGPRANQCRKQSN